MSVPTFTPQLGLPDPSANPITITDTVNLLNSLFLGVSVNGYSAQIITGSSTPGVGDQDKLWFRSDNSGKPLGFYTFLAGIWRPLYTGKPGQITWFYGNINATFDATGLAAAGSLWDGWALCNGQNGTPDIRGKFPINANTADGSGIPQTNFNTGSTASYSGGAFPSNYTIQQSDLPEYSPTFTGGQFDNSFPGRSTYRILIDNNWVNNTSLAIGHQYGQTSPAAQTAIPIVPPYFALALVMFIGY